MSSTALPQVSTIINNTLPAWFINASPQMRNALASDMGRSRRATLAAGQVLDRIVHLPAFARPLLAKALQDAFGPGLDVDADHFYHVSFERDWLTGRAAPKSSTTQSLLQAALQNFEVSEQAQVAQENTSLIYRNLSGRDHLQARSDPLNRQNVSPERFIELCRKVDVGGQYQRHLRHVLHPVARADVPGSVGSEEIKQLLIEKDRLALRVESHIARMKGLIDEAAYQALLALESETSSGQLFTLQMLGFTLRDVLVMQAPGATGCVVYLPGEPEAPLRSYASLDAFMQTLRTKLRNEDYQRYFDRFLAQRSKGAFFPSLQDRLAPQSVHSVARGKGFHRQLVATTQDDPNANLDLQTVPLGITLGEFLYLQSMLHIKDDARVLAVPTDDEDARTRMKRLAQWREYGLDALNLAAFFVPGLGEAMLLASGAQLLVDTFEGVDAWRHGDMSQALDHLSQVAENIAFLAAMGAAGKWASSPGAATVEPPSFIARMQPVTDSTGQLRLWDSISELRRLHPSLADFDDKTLTRIMAVADVDAATVRHALTNDQTPPAALIDSAKRFRLSENAARSVEAFEAAYRESEQSSDPLVTLLRRDFPSLTLASARELLASATAEERLAMQTSGRIALEVAGKVRGHLRQTRMSRVLEGFFLAPSHASPDLQRLTLRSVELFAGWPDDLRLEIREGTAHGALLDSIGPEQSTERRLLVRGKNAFQPCDGQGRSIGREGSLFSAILRALPQEARQAIGLADADIDARVLKGRVFKWLKQQPAWAARTLGQWTPDGALRMPMRLADGRIGYPLSGRGAGFGEAPSEIPDEAPSELEQQLVQAMTQLYPESPDLPAQVRDMARRQRPLADLLATTRQRIEAWQPLYWNLLAWVEADDTGVLINEDLRPARRTVATAIERAWRYSHSAAPRGPRSLTLEHITLPQLPALPDFYADIRRMDLNHVSADLPAANVFLEHFPALTHLNLRASFLAIPDVLPRLERLEHLSLERMPWTIDQAVMDVLMDIPELDSLSLASSPLAQFTDIGRLRLSTLWINNTGLTEWPQWAHSLGLNELDISDNHIVEIPDEVIENPHDPDRHLVIYAYNNPLEHQSLENYWRNDTGFGHRYRLDYDFPEDIRELPVEGMAEGSDSESSDEDNSDLAHPSTSDARAPVASVELWIRPDEPALNDRLRAAWAQVVQAGDAPHLLVLLQRLRQAADFRLFHAELAWDVLTVLESVATDAALRAQVEVIANDRLFGADQTCQDGARLIFSDIQVLVYSEQALRGVAPAQRTQVMLGVIRRLFRLNEVQAIADAEILRREGLGVNVDAAEVRMAYRIGLADELALPGQPHRMVWERLAAVDHGALLDARRRVLEAEQGPAFLEFAVADRQWNARLRAEHGPGMELATAVVQTRMAALEDHPPEDPDEYHRQGQALIARREADEHTMLIQLTDLYRAGW